MQHSRLIGNPFGMIVDPEAVIDAMNRSDRLERLQRRIYRPLDKLVLPNGTTVQDTEELDPITTAGFEC